MQKTICDHEWRFSNKTCINFEECYKEKLDWNNGSFIRDDQNCTPKIDFLLRSMMLIGEAFVIKMFPQYYAFWDKIINPRLKSYLNLSKSDSSFLETTQVLDQYSYTPNWFAHSVHDNEFLEEIIKKPDSDLSLLEENIDVSKVMEILELSIENANENNGYIKEYNRILIIKSSYTKIDARLIGC